jgi:DNA-binding NtrC family response regulator
VFKTPLLIIDDYDPNVTVLSAMLKDEFDVQIANSVEGASVFLKSDVPRLILLDLGQSPSFTPEQGFRLLQSIQPGSRCKGIVCTQYSERDVAARAVRYGAYDVLYKPLDLTILKGVLRRAGWVAELEHESMPDTGDSEEDAEPASVHQAAFDMTPGASLSYRESISLKVNQQRIETDLIRTAFALFRGNLSRAAQELGISRSTLYRRIRQYGLQRAAEAKVT